jgi:hypothetical protein
MGVRILAEELIVDGKKVVYYEIYQNGAFDI